jgi:hypothetical protein
VSDEGPLYLDEPSELFEYDSVGGGEFAYIQSRANIGSVGVSIRDFGAALQGPYEGPMN